MPTCVCAKCFSCTWLFVILWTYGPPGSSVHGIFQTRILEWDAIFFSRGSSGNNVHEGGFWCEAVGSGGDWGIRGWSVLPPVAGCLADFSSKCLGSVAAWAFPALGSTHLGLSWGTLFLRASSPIFSPTTACFSREAGRLDSYVKPSNLINDGTDFFKMWNVSCQTKHSHGQMWLVGCQFLSLWLQKAGIHEARSHYVFAESIFHWFIQRLFCLRHSFPKMEWCGLCSMPSLLQGQG